MTNYYGIDLGTTNSLIACVDENGEPYIIDNDLGQKITPSAVKIVENSGENSEIIVGNQAKTYANLSIFKGLDDGSKIYTSFKRHMKYDVEELNEVETDGSGYNDEYNPVFLSSTILNKLKMDSEKLDHEIEDVVITVPSNFSESAKRNTLKAAELAGLNVKALINEPTAAAIYYAYERTLEPGIYAVYDMGGGTFDCTFLKIDGYDIEIITSEGVESLGGDDMDKELFKLIKEKFNLNSENLGSYEPIPPLFKIELSNSINSSLFVEGKTEIIEREEYEVKIKDMIDVANLQVETTIDKLIDQGIISNTSDIKGFLLAGGSTRTPIVKESLEKFNVPIFDNVNVDEIVAMGAAQYSAIKSDSLNETQKEKYDNELEEVSNKSYGTIVGIFNHDTEPIELIRNENRVVISKDSKLPVKNSIMNYTVYEGQKKVKVDVTESNYDTDDIQFIKILWQGVLDLPELENGFPPERPLTCTYLYDENQIHVTFEDKLSGNKIIDVIDLVQNKEDHDDEDNLTSFDDLILD